MTENPAKKKVEYSQKKKNKKIYVSRVITNSMDKTRFRLISKVVDSEFRFEMVNLEGEQVVQVSPGGRTEWIAKVLETDDRELVTLQLQRYEATTNNPHHNYGLSFTKEELTEFIKFIRAINILPLETPHKAQFTDSDLAPLLGEDQEWFKEFEKKRDLIKIFVEQHITEHDIVTLAYRRKQIEIFQKMLEDTTFFDSLLKEQNARGIEQVWQNFFQKNSWIFGYGLNYIFTSSLDNKQLETTVLGNDFTGDGKRTDAFMKTRSIISSTCFVEIKKHNTPLLDTSDKYRAGTWRVSAELTGGIAQIQRTVDLTVKHFTSKFTSKLGLNDKEGHRTGEELYFYQPKSYLIIGSLKQFFNTDNQVSEEKFSSFELFRRNISNPQIITFDELYERAKFIVEHTNAESLSSKPDDFDF